MSEIVDNIVENTELIQRIGVTGTPFEVITVDELGSFGCLGQFRLTEYYNDVNECIKEMERITWERIINVMVCILQADKDGAFNNTNNTTK